MRAARCIPRTARLALLAVLASGTAAWADDERPRSPTVQLPKYRQECAACHLAYPPGMLPAESWRRLMANLPRHFGTDASLDAATVQELSTWLAANAATFKGVHTAPPEDRITLSNGFIRKHDEVPPAVWKRPAVGSAANCAACHTRAEQGDFNEHAVRIPR